MGGSKSSVNLNDLTTSQTLYWTAANKGGITNKPFDAAGFCFVIADGNRVVQFVANAAGEFAYRTCFSGTFSNWKQFSVS